MAETYSVSSLVLDAMMSIRTVSFVLGKCRKIAISVFNFVTINLGILLLMKHEPKRAVCVRTIHKAVQLLVQNYSISCRVLVNHIERIQWMVRGVWKVRSCSPYFLLYYDMLYAYICTVYSCSLLLSRNFFLLGNKQRNTDMNTTIYGSIRPSQQLMTQTPAIP